MPELLLSGLVDIHHAPYANAIAAAGGLPVQLPREADPAALVDRLDGLVVAGGEDVDPRRYGAVPGSASTQLDPDRDAHESGLIAAALDRRLPLLGICRGHQLLNVALGGTLYQDIATQLPKCHPHVDNELYDELYHDVTLVPGSDLDRLYQADRTLRVTSIHHQAIDRLGDGLVVEALSTLDGVIEAVRWTGPSYARGLQWHPEFHADRATLLASAPVMLDFLQACARRLEDGPDTSQCGSDEMPAAETHYAT